MPASLDPIPGTVRYATIPPSYLDYSEQKKTITGLMMEGETMTPDDVSCAGANDFPLMRRIPIFQLGVLLCVSTHSALLLPFVPVVTGRSNVSAGV
jgi:hypothetical protein